ncbi:hypothetical protein KQI49_03060 [Virgibacillus sp. MSJ-26]|uniref:hypothetical protein n=1 Tax=Virgibacillus sp. MSJ-26 TaxID=2841522 RepID=UPI001C101AFC|nr:hypothetical protein [Virgibacillus sp. MSJ-26]MBU5465806.1 hypothetical protein [Virgibacillus sp. MSJ-26]
MFSKFLRKLVGSTSTDKRRYQDRYFDNLHARFEIYNEITESFNTKYFDILELMESRTSDSDERRYEYIDQILNLIKETKLELKLVPSSLDAPISVERIFNEGVERLIKAFELKECSYEIQRTLYKNLIMLNENSGDIEKLNTINENLLELPEDEDYMETSHKHEMAFLKCYEQAINIIYKE